jgi:hypothetical protein
MKVYCRIEDDEVEHEDSGRVVPGVVATCLRCGHVTKAYGTGEGSRKRCLCLMRDECPNAENNYYADARD